jgi:hypothetical protein
MPQQWIVISLKWHKCVLFHLKFSLKNVYQLSQGGHKVKLFVIKVAKCKKVVFWLPYKILNYITVIFAKSMVTEEKDGSDIWPMDNFLKL